MLLSLVPVCDSRHHLPKLAAVALIKVGLVSRHHGPSYLSGSQEGEFVYTSRHAKDGTSSGGGG